MLRKEMELSIFLCFSGVSLPPLRGGGMHRRSMRSLHFVCLRREHAKQEVMAEDCHSSWAKLHQVRDMVRKLSYGSNG